MRSLNDRLRRTADVALIVIAAPVWVPAIAMVGAAVLVTSGRPVFFIQERVGLGGEVFEMRKFRSMRNGKNALIPDPDRITAIGRILRRTSLDELPQILNVAEGSMSLVGPRPLLTQQVSMLSPTQRRRLDVLPGLTGLAQINGRNALSWEQRFCYDLDWVKNPSLWHYFRILSQTAPTVLSGDGVTGHDAGDRFVIDLENAGLHAAGMTPLETVDLDVLASDDHDTYEAKHLYQAKHAA